MNGEEGEVRVKMPRQGEILGTIEALLGANRLAVRCQDGKARICRIPGRLRKRLWMREGDIVIIKPWQIQGDKHGDIIWRYTPTEASVLRRKGVIKNLYSFFLGV